MKYLTIGFILDMFLEFGHCEDLFPELNETKVSEQKEYLFLEYTDEKGEPFAKIKTNGELEYKDLNPFYFVEDFYDRGLRPHIDYGRDDEKNTLRFDRRFL